MRGLSLHHLMERRAEFVGPGSIDGTLVELGGYPGALPDGTGIVRGEVYRLESAELLTALDSAEGPEFPRGVGPVRLDDGRLVSAWIYWFSGSPDQGVVIPDGDYRRHVTARPLSRERTRFT